MATIQKRKKSDGTYSYRVMVRQNDGFPPSYKTLPTKEEAKDWARDEEMRRRQGLHHSYRANERKTMAELIDRYLTIVLPTKPKNAKDTRRQLNWWKEEIGKYAVQNVTADLIATCRQKLASGITPKGNIRSPSTVNRYLAALSAVMSYGVKECGWVQDNPCLRVTKFRESPGRDRVASKDECLRLLHECQASRNEHLYLIVFIAITTGMRLSEITKLKWDCVYLEQGLINLKDTKNGRPRTVSIVGPALEIMRKRHSSRKQQQPFVFPAKKRFGHICIRKAWNEACKRAQVNNLRFHDLRHTFATYAAEEGASNLELSAALGNTLQMLERYTHINGKITQRLSSAVHDKILGGHNGKK